MSTKNYNLAQLELSNAANIPLLLNNTFETIDRGLTLNVGISSGTGNDYVLNLGSITLSSANKGISFKFWADKDSNGAVTINGTYNLVKASGNPVKNLKRNAPYTITYDGGTNFFLASGGVDDVNFSASDLLSGKTANNSDGEKVTGTMPNIGQQTATINAGGKVTISKGYHDGTGYVQSNSMSTQLTNLGVTLTSASQLVSGIKAVNKNGSLITGTATIESLGGKKYFSNYYTNTILTDDTHNLLIPLSSLNIPFTPSVVKGYLRTGYEGHYVYDGFSITSGGTGWGINSFRDDDARRYSSFHLSNISSSTTIYVYRIDYSKTSTIQVKKGINEIFVEAYS